MHPILLEHPYLGSYRVFLLLGLLSGFLLARWRAPSVGIERRHIDNIALLIAVTGVAGGRFFSRLFYYPTPLTFWQALKVWEDGGLVFYGGVVFGIATVLTYAAVRRVKLLPLLDVLAPSLALGLAFGRIGCFLVGCCWGDICGNPPHLQHLGPDTRQQIQTLPALCSENFPLAVRFPPNTGAYEQHEALGLISHNAERSLPVHPVQLYEAALAFALCAFLHRAFRRRQADGQIALLFGINYGLIRFSLELFRADSQPSYWGHFTVSQCISLTFISFCISAFYFRRRAWQTMAPSLAKVTRRP